MEPLEVISTTPKPTAKEAQSAASAPEAAAWLTNPSKAPRAASWAAQLEAEPEWEGPAPGDDIA